MSQTSRVHSLAVQAILPKLDLFFFLRFGRFILPILEVKMIEFLAEWMVTLLMPASHILEVRAPHFSFYDAQKNTGLENCILA